jgi:multidrug efflux system membrane fusion protein
MNRSSWRRLICATALTFVFWGAPSLRADEPVQLTDAAASADQHLRQAFTLPYKEYKISFPTMGVIKDVKIKEGDVIKKGDVIMKQDDSEDRAELKVLDAAIGQGELGLKVGEAKLRVAQSEFKSKSNLKNSGAFNDLEVERAEAERDVASAQLDQAKKELEQTKAKRDKQATHVDNMTLKAPTDGVIKELINDIGSNIDPTKPVVTVVQNNPLLVEVQVPALASLQLKKGETLRVTYDKKNWREATVNFLSPQADAGSGMRMIRLELANADGEPSGLQIFVELPDKLLAAAGGK